LTFLMMHVVILFIKHSLNDTVLRWTVIPFLVEWVPTTL